MAETKLYNNYVRGSTAKYAVVKATNRSISDDQQFKLPTDGRLEPYVQGTGMENSQVFTFSTITETPNVKLVDRVPAIWKKPITTEDILKETKTDV